MPCVTLAEAILWLKASAARVWCKGLGSSSSKAPENARWMEASPAMDCAFCSAGEGEGHGLEAGYAKVISFLNYFPCLTF